MARQKRNYPLCHIVFQEDGTTHLKSFAARGKNFAFQKSISVDESEAFPKVTYDKTWKSAFSPSLNVAILPASEVFYRILNLPTVEESEIPEMVELQLERISPLPPNQIYWSWEILRDHEQTGESNHTNVLVSIVEQKTVHNFCSDLESRNFYADMVSIGHLLHFKDVPDRQDVLRIHATRKDEAAECLIQWWVDGQLRNISQMEESSLENLVPQVEQELRQTYWAGQMEGWIDTMPPLEVHCRAEDKSGWNALKEGLSVMNIQFCDPIPEIDLDTRLATYFGRGEIHSDLQPGDIKKTYQSRQFDSLWMNALVGLAALYLVGLGVYFFFLKQAQNERDGVKGNIAAISNVYTNALKLDEQIRITQGQLDLRFAALDSWKVVVDVLPQDLTFRQFKFSKGESLLLSGEGPYGKNDLVNSYVDALTALVAADGKKTFTDVQAKPIQNSRGKMSWAIECMLPE